MRRATREDGVASRENEGMKGKKTSRKRKRRKRQRARERRRREREQAELERALWAATAHLRPPRNRRLGWIHTRGISVRFEFDYDNPIPLSSTDPVEMVAEAERYCEAIERWESEGYPTRGEA